MRLALYGGLSTLLAVGVIFNAMHQRSNFYAACVYLSKSSACVMILLNMGFLMAVCLGKALQAIFFGNLRAIEVEHLYERSWYAVTETCLAMTIFREEFNIQFVIIFTTLLFIKIFHWLCQDRVEFMEQAPNNRVSFHVRMINLMALLLIVDVVLANHAIGVTMTKGPNMMVMFGFEYTILTCTILSTIGKYILNVIDLRSDDPWEGKSMYVFYLDLLTDFFKLVTYIVFFIFICYYYQLPLHIIRDVYVTFRSFIQKCRDLYRYRRATRNMNELYPNATAEDFARMNDNTCIICREDMQPTVIGTDQNANQGSPREAQQQQQQQQQDQPKKLPCGHIFHFHCLRSWLERQQSCPTCRRSVLSDGSNNNSNNNNNRQPRQDQPQAPDANRPASPQAAAQPQQPPAQATGDQFAAAAPPPYTQFSSPSQQHQEQQQQPSTGQPGSFSFLTPEHSGVGPYNRYQNVGMIPLIPLPGTTQQQPQPTSETNNPSNSELPESLSDEQLQILSTVTREAMTQRLRLLETVQNQIYQSMQLLTQALSVMPSENNRVPRGSSPSENEHNKETVPVASSTTISSSPSSPAPPSSDIRKGKMKEASSSSNIDYDNDDRTEDA